MCVRACGSCVATGFVLWSGSGALLRASNDVDLVLNVVAAIFVVELCARHARLTPARARAHA